MMNEFQDVVYSQAHSGYTVEIYEFTKSFHFVIWDCHPGWLSKAEAHNVGCDGDISKEDSLEQALLVLGEI